MYSRSTAVITAEWRLLLTHAEFGILWLKSIDHKCKHFYWCIYMTQQLHYCSYIFTYVVFWIANLHRYKSALPHYCSFYQYRLQNPLVTSTMPSSQFQFNLHNQQVESTLLMRYGTKLTASNSCRWYPSVAAMFSSTCRYSSCFMRTVVLVSKKRSVCHLRMRSMLLRLASLSTSHI